MAEYSKRNKFIWAVLTLFACLLIAAPVITETIFHFDKEFLKKAEEKCGKEGPARFTAWEELMRKDKGSSDREKLAKVNHFFNSRIQFVSDIDLWGVQDYWATPVEFLCKRAGDCEDFAIAKYFTLMAMGVDEEKLKIAYVKALQYNIAHMVLTYYSEPGAEPLILDNLVDSLDPASKRTDLMPVFSFNGAGLWTAKQRGQGKSAGSAADRLKPWQGLLQRMSENKL
ncbi:MAG: transglutaminase-like cysteine peptidase [Deltaproteobacteria bacterium]|nr:transglutaminase-like cysteine peptidase [Deltaproteobacteria bacterium]